MLDIIKALEIYLLPLGYKVSIDPWMPPSGMDFDIKRWDTPQSVHLSLQDGLLYDDDIFKTKEQYLVNLADPDSLVVLLGILKARLGIPGAGLGHERKPLTNRS